MPERFNAGQLMAMVGAAVLLVSLFLDWYEPDLSAWEVFEIADLVLAGLAIAALAAALPMRLPGAGERRALAEERSLPWIGLAALAFVLVTLINDPPAARDLPLDYGAWVGLVGALALAAGGFLSNARISVVISPRPDERPPAAAAPTPAERVERDAGTVADRDTTETRRLDDRPPHEA
jgi:hypothetical protein